MSKASRERQIERDNVHIAFRPSQVYTVAAPGPAYTIFSVNNGAIEIVNLFGRITAAAVGATTIRLTANGVNMDAAAIAVNGAVGTIFYSSCNVAGTLINAAAAPRTVATLTTMLVGTQPAGPGNIVATWAIGTSITCEFYLVFRKLSPVVQLNVN